MGRGAPYDYTETLPEVTISMEKILDDHYPIYVLAFGNGTALLTAAEAQCSIRAQTCKSDQLNAEGTVEQQITTTGLYLSSVSYNFLVDGPSTETVEFMGNDVSWDATPSAIFTTSPAASTTTVSGVVQREDIDLVNSVLPTDDMGTNLIYQNITVSASLGRNDVNRLGQKKPYIKTVQLPVEVSTEINVLMIGTGISFSGVDTVCGTNTSYTTDREITVCTCQGLTVSTGAANRLRSVRETGGGTDGSNATLSYSYATYNDLTISNTTALA